MVTHNPFASVIQHTTTMFPYVYSIHSPQLCSLHYTNLLHMWVCLGIGSAARSPRPSHQKTKPHAVSRHVGLVPAGTNIIKSQRLVEKPKLNLGMVCLTRVRAAKGSLRRRGVFCGPRGLRVLPAVKGVIWTR